MNVKETKIMEIAEDLARDLLKTLQLDYGNGELYLDGSELWIVVEAPNNSTMGHQISLESFLEDISNVEYDDITDEQFIANLEDESFLSELKKDLKDTLIYELRKTVSYFDADEQFEELWSREFGKHNGFTASQFLRMLQEDQEFFENIDW